MLLTVGVSLYSTRLILYALGNIDYGIFALVGGVVAVLAFLKNTMSTSTQRFLSFYQGKNDLQSQKSVFFNSLILHILVGIVIFFLLVSLESILFDQFLNIPNDRINSAKIVYRTTLISLLFSMVNVPFIGSLVAHENLFFVAVMNIFEVLSKLGIAFILITSDQNKLEIYGYFLAALSLITLIIYAIFCFLTYPECTVKGPKINQNRITQLSSFAGWNLFGALCGLGRTQGLAVVLNLFFGATINAAYGIANQLSSQIIFFSSTMLRALNPQIMKSEGSDNRDRTLRLSMIASKFGFFLVAILAIPAIFEMTKILHFWLKHVPEYTSIFTNLILVSILLNQTTIGLQSALQATGKIKLYQIVVGSVILLTLPFAYILLKLGYRPYYVYISYLALECIAVVLRLFIAKNIIGLSISLYLNQVFLRLLTPSISSALICLLITNFLEYKYRFLLTGILSTIVFMFTIYIFSMDKEEKKLIHNFFTLILKKIKRK